MFGHGGVKVRSELEAYVVCAWLEGESGLVFEHPLTCLILVWRNLALVMEVLLTVARETFLPSQHERERRREREEEKEEEEACSFDPWGVLGLEAGASLAAAKKQYRLLALKWHPDKNLDDPTTAELKMSELNAAMEEIERFHSRGGDDHEEEKEEEEEDVAGASEAAAEEARAVEREARRARAEESRRFEEAMRDARSKAVARGSEQSSKRARRQRKKKKKKGRKAPPEDAAPFATTAPYSMDACTDPLAVALAAGTKGMFFERLMRRASGSPTALLDILDDTGNTVCHFAAYHARGFGIDAILRVAGPLTWHEPFLRRNFVGQRPLDVVGRDLEDRLRDLTARASELDAKLATRCFDWKPAMAVFVRVATAACFLDPVVVGLSASLGVVSRALFFRVSACLAGALYAIFFAPDQPEALGTKEDFGDNFFVSPIVLDLSRCAIIVACCLAPVIFVVRAKFWLLFAVFAAAAGTAFLYVEKTPFEAYFYRSRGNFGLAYELNRYARHAAFWIVAISFLLCEPVVFLAGSLVARALRFFGRLRVVPADFRPPLRTFANFFNTREFYQLAHAVLLPRLTTIIPRALGALLGFFVVTFSNYSNASTQNNNASDTSAAAAAAAAP
ncbi:hypothetical protein CTAYLR_005746 [Chrysophaeum taylorii]|uniref:J domain-containing protein n=1 Tax=Chrysophaeum taylorii TaxID=2483200 RepID=A0AAD7UK80_9STRA|nr:hypothetical protein CTAYLR_005746 [Chrysophaeum taylorii]